MEVKLYTNSHDIKLLKKYTKNDQIFTSEELSNISLKEYHLLKFKDLYKKIMQSKADLLEIIQFIKKNDIKKLVSIGSYFPIQEYYISKKTGAEILCYDFDKAIIKYSKIIFKDKISIQFYDMNTSLNNIIKPNHDIDCIIFFQSLYIFNSKKYEKYLREVNNLKIKYIIDNASITPLQIIFKTKISRLIKFPIKILLFKLFPNLEKFYVGKFHGYSRTKSSLVKIYNVSNLKIIKHFKSYFFLEKK